MSSTNKTTNYDLSQFIGTDKPAWLVDYNGDMGKIDTAIKNAADGATTADGKADTANNNIGTMANLTTTAKSTLVEAINEVDAAAGTAQTTAESAASTASTASTTASGLATYLTLSSVTRYTTANMSVTAGGGSLSSANCSITVARNSAGTVAKIYGQFYIWGYGSGYNKVLLDVDTGLRPDTAFTITPAGFGINDYDATSTGVHGGSTDIYVRTDGKLEFHYYSDVASNGGLIKIYFDPCIYFIKDYGDQPQA